MRARFRKLAGLFAGMLLFTGLALVITAGPAQAATYIKVCSHSDGYVSGGLYVYNDSVNYEGYIGVGYCATNVRDDNGGARVDVDPGGIGGDVDSWNKIGSGGSPPQTWGSCYNNEDGASNPYSGSGAWTTYKTWYALNCHN